jgi:hypothetical protein
MALHGLVLGLYLTPLVFSIELVVEDEGEIKIQFI